MNDPLLTLMIPYLQATLLSLVLFSISFVILNIIHKQSYRKRTVILTAPSVGSVTIMLVLGASCFMHWLSLTKTSLYFGVCHQTSLEIMVFICTSFVALGFTSIGLATGSATIRYFLGDRIAIRLSNAKPLLQSDAREIYDTVNRLSRKAGVDTPKLYLIECSTPIISTRGKRKNPIIMMSVGLIENLTSRELEASLAHELSHIKNNDGLIRALVSSLKFVAPFVFLNYLIEPAIHREREFLADEGSVALTGEPRALISALIKTSKNTNVGYTSFQNMIGFSLENPLLRGIFSKHPPLVERLNRLLELEREKHNARATSSPP